MAYQVDEQVEDLGLDSDGLAADLQGSTRLIELALEKPMTHNAPPRNRSADEPEQYHGKKSCVNASRIYQKFVSTPSSIGSRLYVSAAEYRNTRSGGP